MAPDAPREGKMSGVFLAAAALTDPDDAATAAVHVSGFGATLAEEAN
jgi:hypothetical protein